MRIWKLSAKLIRPSAMAALLVAMFGSAFAIATSTATYNNTSLEDKSATYNVQANEYLTIDFLSGNPVQVTGSGKISTQSTQNWTVYAKDGLKWSGTIYDSEDPRWRMTVQWNFDLTAAAAGSAGSTHRALAGTYAVVQKDVTGSAGDEYDFHYTVTEPDDYEFFVQPPDGDGTPYYFPGYKEDEGSRVRTPVGSAIDIDEFKDAASVAVWVFNRGWMTLRSNSQTTEVKTIIGGNVVDGTMQAWDYGEDPPRLVDSYSLD
jgi:hypothetical protein